MSETTFFVRGRNRGNERKIILVSAALLVGKAPTKNKRIRMKVRMPLNGQKPVGTPDWVMKAMEFVAQSHDAVNATAQFSGFDVTFNDENLFEQAKAAANKCQLRSFVIQEFGDAENPDIVMEFLIYAPFSSNLWRFCGQYGGEEYWAKFEQVEEPEDEDLELTGDDEEEEENDEEEAGEVAEG